MSKTKEAYEQVREDLGLEFQPTPIRIESNLWTALAGFQQEVPVIHKATQGYGYTYADLTKIIQVINPILAKHGLGYTQPLMGTAIKTIVFHIESGQTLESVVEIPQGVSLKGMNDFQSFGSGVTYYRRYALSSALGLVTDKDTDASGEQVKKLPTIDAKRFQSAIEAIQAGKYTREELESKFSLTEGQTDLINAL